MIFQPDDTESRFLAARTNGLGLIRLTRTMISKSIIDANTTIREFARSLGVDYDTMSRGEKCTVQARFEDGAPCCLNFYKTQLRGDRRFSCSGLRAFAREGDLIALTFDDGAVVSNVTRGR